MSTQSISQPHRSPRGVPAPTLWRGVFVVVFAVASVTLLSLPSPAHGEMHAASGIVLFTVPALLTALVAIARRGDLAIWSNALTPGSRRALLIGLAIVALVLMTRTSTSSLAPAIGIFVVAPALVRLGLSSTRLSKVHQK